MKNKNKIIISSILIIGAYYYFFLRQKKVELEFQIRDVGGSDVYYKRKVGDNTWEFSSKDEFEKYKQENENVKLVKSGKMELPIKVNGSYKGRNCDELHAFESTGGRKVGGMNTKVNAELIKVYKAGINPMITDVKVTFDTKNMISNWEVTIDKSTDGKAWVGLTSRGSSGDKSAYTRAYLVKGQRPKDIEESIKKKGEKNPELKMIKDWTWNFDKDKNIIGKCPTRQLFYSYTMPTLYPSHK